MSRCDMVLIVSYNVGGYFSSRFQRNCLAKQGVKNKEKISPCVLGRMIELIPLVAFIHIFPESEIESRFPIFHWEIQCYYFFRAEFNQNDYHIKAHKFIASRE